MKEFLCVAILPLRERILCHHGAISCERTLVYSTVHNNIFEFNLSVAGSTLPVWGDIIGGCLCEFKQYIGIYIYASPWGNDLRSEWKREDCERCSKFRRSKTRVRKGTVRMQFKISWHRDHNESPRNGLLEAVSITNCRSYTSLCRYCTAIVFFLSQRPAASEWVVGEPSEATLSKMSQL
jgi:hypothetical protein